MRVDHRPNELMSAVVIRVDIAMSALSSAIDQTGHYRVGVRDVGQPTVTTKYLGSAPTRRAEGCVSVRADQRKYEAVMARSARIAGG